MKIIPLNTFDQVIAPNVSSLLYTTTDNKFNGE